MREGSLAGGEAIYTLIKLAVTGGGNSLHQFRYFDYLGFRNLGGIIEGGKYLLICYAL